MTRLDKKNKIRKELTNGCHFIKHQSMGEDEIKMECQECGHRYWVRLGAVINETLDNGGCTCSECGKKSLMPL